MTKNKYILSAFVVMMMLVQTSCMKDVKPNLDPQAGTGSTSVVGIDVSGPIDAYYSASAQAAPTVWFNAYNNTVKFYPSPDTANLKINVTYFGSGNAPEDIKVTLAVDPTTLASFNSNHATNSFYYFWGFDATMPAAADIWSIPTTVTIPKGQKTATVSVKLKNTLALGNPYAIPITLTATSYGTISTNQNKALYVFQRVNNYDGLYMVNGSVIDAQSVYTGKYPKYVEFLTYDNTSVAMLDQNYGAFYYLINSIATGGAANLSATAFRFDPTTNKCTAVLTGNGGVPGSTLGTLVPNGPNQFTPTNVSYNPNAAFKINYTVSAARYTINDVYTYVGERNDAN